MTEKELAGIAARGLGYARVDRNKRRGGFVVCVFNDGELRRMGGVEDRIARTLGEDWLNSGVKKDAAFGVLREACTLMPPEAIVICTASNKFVPTDKFWSLSPQERERLARSSHDEQHAAAKCGIYEVVDSITAIAQTPELVCIMCQEVECGGRPAAKPEIQIFPQENLGGRLKMFGKETQ